jgi:hypothetical protein
MNTCNLVDFNFDIPSGKEINNDKIESIVSEYYRAQGYIVESEYGMLTAEKDGKNLSINISNYGHTIMVSVCNNFFL